MYFATTWVMKFLIDSATKEINKPKPSIREDEFYKENGYSFDYVMVFEVFEEEVKGDLSIFQKKFAILF